MDDANKDLTTDDPCYRILVDEDFPLDMKADVWDEFWESKSAAAFADQIERFNLSEPLKTSLINARRHSSAVEQHHFQKAIHSMSQIDPKMLQMAEDHPTVLKMLLGAATSEEKSSPKKKVGSASGEDNE